MSGPATPNLFSMELRTTRWQVMLRWYSTALGLPVLLQSEENRYALLEAGDSKLTLLGRDKVDLPSRRITVDWQPDY